MRLSNRQKKALLEMAMNEGAFDGDTPESKVWFRSSSQPGIGIGTLEGLVDLGLAIRNGRAKEFRLTPEGKQAEKDFPFTL